MPDEDTITLNVKDEEMPEIAESGNLTVALTGMANEFGASAARRTQRADQTSADASALWTISMQSPTVMAAMGMRVAQESGAGRTRIEANSPGTTGG